MAKEAPHIAYHPGSPWSHGLKTSDPTVGDMHQWNGKFSRIPSVNRLTISDVVWHGTQEKYQIFDTLGGRFNSEFGMEAFPHAQTIASFCTNPKELYPQSHTLDFHNKADGHERRIATYLVENFRTAMALDAYIHLTQLSQAEALMFGYRGWRKQFGNKRHCGGALVWQLNDCWPVVSWSIVDYWRRKKPAWYAMKRVLAPVAVGIQREHWDWSLVHAREPPELKWEAWIVTRLPHTITVRIEVRFVSIASGKEIKPPVVKENIEVEPNTTVPVGNGMISTTKEESHVLALRACTQDGPVIRDCDWPQPLKYLDFANRKLNIRHTSNDSVVVDAQRPVKGLVFQERDGVWLEDNCIDVVPGDAQTVRVRGWTREDHPLEYRYLGQDS